MLIVYSNKLQTTEIPKSTELDLDEISKEAGKVEAKIEVEEKINPTPEELLEMEKRLNELQSRPLSQIVKEDNDGVRRLSYTKNA